MIEQLAPTVLSQFIRLDACQRYLHFRLHPEVTDTLRKRYAVQHRPLSPLLKRAGQRFEDEVVATLAAQHQLIDLSAGDVDATLAAIAAVGDAPVILAQAALDGTIGGWRAAGRADLIEIVRSRSGALHALVADVKASREERLEHRVQVAAYATMLGDLCRDAGLPLKRIVGAVVHRPAAGEFTTLHDPELHFDLAQYQALVRSLVEGDDAPLQRAAAATLDELPFALNARCDGCPFDGVCLPHAAERADIALVPDIGRAARSALAAHEIRDLRTLATLKEPDDSGKLQPHPEHVERLAMLVRDPVLAPQLDQLIARARGVLRRLDPAMRAPARLPDMEPSTLPDRAARPHLVELFLDLQLDEVTGGVYLAAGLLRGPESERMIVRLLDAPPTAQREAELLLDWAVELETALREVATSDALPLHLLVYDRRAQRVALEACARNEAVHPMLGVLVAWLQERPQIEEATCARLREVIGQQRNLKLTCDSLYAVAGEVWDAGQRWSWATPTHDFTKLFRAGVFDNVQRFVREAGALYSVSGDVADAAAIVRLEASSRFGSQIPSEYAYAIWEGAVPTPGRAELLAFAEHRLRALQHLAAACRKNRGLQVPLLPLAQLPAAAGPRDLRSALITFMEMEHAAGLAELLAHVRLPIARRVLTGRTALLEAVAVEERPPVARFRFAHPPGGISVPPRFKVGDWAVLNEAVDGIGPWEIIKGRLVIVSALTEETMELELTPLNAAGEFKYHHDSKLQVQLRCRYTLDEMADDLLGDKVRAALDHLDTNPLARWLAQLTPPETPPVTDETLAAAAERLVAPLGNARPTAPQYAVIAAGATAPVRLVQGPPGSGKSRTLGLAVVARLLAAAGQSRPLRIAVTAKTHSAVQVALDSIAKAWAAWLSTPGADVPLPLTDLPVVKLGGSAVAPRAKAVRWADPRKAPKELRALLGGAVVIGGTPGGLSALVETTQRKARWDGLFDLLLIDEASQMSLPEGLLAASALQVGGQLLVVGDHRQMPPIISHPWNQAVGSLAAWAPERSLFKWLLDADASVVALDESFRLHRDHAAFLQAAIYHADGIHFHSRRTDLLPPHRFDDPFVAAVLQPDVPLVVVEHAERSSRQQNDAEAEIVAALVRACAQLGLEGRDGIGVVVPHRAQKAALRARLPELADADSIDTVERFQGGERDVIIVACTASDPDYIMAEAEFLMDPQRLNVALSRARKKLIVVAAATVFGALPIDLPIFERAALWKRLHAYAAPHPLWSGTEGGVAVRVMGPAATGDDA